MIDGGERLNDADLARIGRLHVESIDDSLPALLGPVYAQKLYAFLARSEREHVLFERIDGRVESVCVVSEDPASLFARIARATLPRLSMAAARALFLRPDFRVWLRGFLTDVFASSSTPHAPEITYVFTNAQLRGRNLGKHLIERVDAYLHARGVSAYFVKTIDSPSNRAIGFYLREGFEPIGTRQEAGRRFVEFRKLLSRSA